MQTIWFKQQGQEPAPQERQSRAVPGARSLFEKIWQRHLVIDKQDSEGEDALALLYIDRHYLQDGSPRAFDMIRHHGLPVRRPDLTFGAVDHYMPSDSGRLDTIDDEDRRHTVAAFMSNTARQDITVFGEGDPARGIMHVVGPEQGLSLPGTTIVCSDSHTPTHGGIGALAFGIGSSESGHVLATQGLWTRKPKSMRITIDGVLPASVTAKDMALAIIAHIGAFGAAGHVVEYAGEAVRALTVEGRLTLCNLATESGARAAIIAPDDVTFRYLENRPYSPKGAAWDDALTDWRTLRSDEGAAFDREWTLDAAQLAPVVTWGISPEHALPITADVPDPDTAVTPQQRIDWRRAIDYMRLVPGMPLTSVVIDRVFIGSCTNGRIEDLRSVAALVKGRKIVVPAWIVPGSTPVREQAEAEGLDTLFLAAGFEWRHAGCSMCVGQNGDHLAPGQRCVSTTNRNFIGRQGRDAMTHLASPVMAAAAALTGRLTDVRELLAVAPSGTASGAQPHA